MPRSADHFHCPRILHGVLALLLALGLTARAADVSVEARLSRNVTTLAEPVQYEIKITGGQRIGPAPEISAEGVEVRFVGNQRNFTMSLGGPAVSTVSLLYQVTGDQHGRFTIPSVQVEVDGQKYKTQPIAIAIQQSAALAEGDAPPRAQGIAEFAVPKTTLFVGETIPVELKLYVDTRVHWQLAEMPVVTAEGLALQKMPEPHKVEDTVKRSDGREYDVVTFHTAVTPTKAGKIPLGPAELVYLAQIPRARRGGSSFFDMFDQGMMGDPFFSQTQKMKATAKPVELTVNPLPVSGRPVDFAGAVGNFDLSAEGSPKRVKMGDPVTMKIKVSGQGNFDRVTSPVLKDSTGWRSYPPSNTFHADDDIATRGAKTFEMAVIPEVRKTEMPVFQFSYFDPIAGKYVTRVSQPEALLVEGEIAPPAPVVGASSSDSSATPAPEKKAAPPSDILGLRYDAGEARHSFAPIYLQRQFVLAQGIPLVALLGLLGWRLWPRGDGAALRLAALRRERSALLEKLRGNEIAHADFFDGAARVVQIDTALVTGGDGAGVDAPTARSSVQLDDATSEVIDEIFKTRAELLYAGGGGGGERVSGAERERVLAALTDFGRSHGKR
jgi:BatD DUF11 like domain